MGEKFGPISSDLTQAGGTSQLYFDLTPYLDDDEVANGTPVVWADNAGITISEEAVTVAIVARKNGTEIPVGQAIGFRATATAQMKQDVMIYCAFTTDGSNGGTAERPLSVLRYL